MYSSQRALSFLPELKRNKFAWDILNQSHRFSMFWKNASASDIGWLNTTFVCCFLWRNRELVSPRSYVRGRSLVMFRSRQLHVVWNILVTIKQTYHWSHVVVDFFWRRIFFLPGNFSTGEFFCRGIFIPGNFSRPHKNRAQVHRIQIWGLNIMLLFREVTTHSTRSLSLTCVCKHVRWLGFLD